MKFFSTLISWHFNLVPKLLVMQCLCWGFFLYFLPSSIHSCLSLLFVPAFFFLQSYALYINGDENATSTNVSKYLAKVSAGVCFLCLAPIWFDFDCLVIFCFWWNPFSICVHVKLYWQPPFVTCQFLWANDSESKMVL